MTDLETVTYEIEHLRATHFRAACRYCRPLANADDFRAVERRDRQLEELVQRRQDMLNGTKSLGDTP